MKITKLSILLVLSLLFMTQASYFNPACVLCHDAVKLLQKSVSPQPLEFMIKQIAVPYCSKHDFSKHICKGAIKEMLHIIITSFWQHQTDPHMVCPKLKLCPQEYSKRVLKDDIAEILAGKPEKEWEKPTGRKTLKILHMADPHIDLFYSVGAESNCSEPVCCRTTSLSKSSSNKSTVEMPAGYWGSLNTCDLPLQTFELFLQSIKQHKVDLMIWTGDNTPHDIWQQSQSYNLNYTVLLTQKIKQYTDVRVVASMGNHESFPVNVYDYAGDRESMLVGGLAEIWKSWLDEQAYQMMRKNGFYSIELPEFNNLKIINLNTQAQNDENFFLLKESTDPGRMFEWLRGELQKSEAKGQLVHIVGHIPPQDFVYEWGERFTALVDRFSYTIRGQFYGHTHHDQAGVFFSATNSSKVVNYCLLAPSLTCHKNPQYRVLEVDYDTLQLVDYKQMMLDLRKYSKKDDGAHFQFQYSFKDAYKLDDLTLQGGITQFNEKMKNDKDTQKLYSFLRNSELNPGVAGRSIYCDIMTSRTAKAECMGTEFKESAFEKAIGGWKDLKHKE